MNADFTAYLSTRQPLPQQIDTMEKKRKDKTLEFPEDEAQRIANEAGYIAFLEIMPRKDDEDEQNDNDEAEHDDNDEKH